MRKALMLFGAALVASCAVGPDYKEPIAPTSPATFSEAKNVVFSEAEPQEAWWRLYDDLLLDSLIMKALTTNTDLRVAAANLRRSRELLNEQRVARFPSTSLRAQATAAEATPNAAAIAADAEPNQYEAWAQISYEVDIVGRITRTIEAARADRQAEQAAYDLALITVAADVAHAYADVCSLGAQRLALGHALAVQDASASIAEQRFKVGDGSGLESAQAIAELQRSRAAIPPIEAERRIALYRLAALTGEPPANYPKEAEACVAAPALASELAVGDNPTLLARRPDVRQAERKLAAATARIGVAVADLYPRLTLGLASGVTKEKNIDPVYRLQFTPLTTWTFPNILATRSKIAQARAGADTALATWDGVVLRALVEVESQMALYAAERERNAALIEMRKSSRDAAERARNRRDAGEDSPLTQLDAERRLVESETLVAESNRRLANTEISLFLALGGGWQPAGPAPR